MNGDLSTDLVGETIAIRAADGRTLVEGVCRLVTTAPSAIEPATLAFFFLLDTPEGVRVVEWWSSESAAATTLHVLPPDDPMSRMCSRCVALEGEPCRVMAAGYYHAARKIKPVT